MTQGNFSWQIAHLRAGVTTGDLTRAPVEAIVNSEQTDFELAPNPNTLSGAIRREWGALVQEDLRAQTNRQRMPLGTVLVTGGGPGGTILHVGLHSPEAIDSRKAPDTAVYLPVIRRAVREVLNIAVKRGVRSVAFPLLGCGLFRLDPALVVYEMFGEISAFAEDSDPARPLEVLVMTREQDQVSSIVAAGVQAWIDRFPTGSARPALDLRVPWIDLYEAHHVVCNRHPQWSSWTLARLAELVVGYIATCVTVASSSTNSPTTQLTEGRPAAFGTMREVALKSAKILRGRALDPWTDFLCQRLSLAEKQGHFQRLNEDRNNLAHGRAHRPYQQMRADLEAIVDIPNWRRRIVDEGPPSDSFGAWIAPHPSPSARADFERPGARIGVAEAWGKGGVDYVVPWAGQRFRLRPSE